MTKEEIKELKELNAKRRRVYRLKEKDNERLGVLRNAWGAYQWACGVKTIDHKQP